MEPDSPRGPSWTGAATQRTLLSKTFRQGLGTPPPAEDSETSPPAQVSRYVLCGDLGRGGMGEVFAGHDPLLDRLIAIKRMRPGLSGDTEGRAALTREAQLHAQLNHPNIVHVYDLVFEGDRGHLIVEFIGGVPLSERIGRHGLRSETGLRISLEITRGLAYAHAAGVIHRDLKSENVLMDLDGTAKITDFGIAHCLPTSPAGRTEGLTDRAGTPRAMSPEQSRGEALDARSDLFSLGILLYELFSGSSPFLRADHESTIAAIQSKVQLPLCELIPDTPLVLSQLIDHLLQKRPEHRPASAEEVVERIEAMLEALTHKREDSPLEGLDVRERQVAVLHCELDFGPPALDARSSQQELVELLRWRRAIEDAAKKHGDTRVDHAHRQSTICFGHPVAHENNCERAAQTLLDAQARVAAGGLDQRLRAGLAAGTVITTEIDGRAQATGPAFEIARELAHIAPNGHCYVDGHAQRLMARDFDFIAQAVVRSQALGQALVPHQLSAHRPGPVSDASPGAGPLLGRHHLLGHIESAFTRCLEQGVEARLFVGEAGMGKTTLLRRATAQLLARGARVLSLRATSPTQHSPFYPFLELLFELLPPQDVEASESDSRTRSQVGQQLKVLGLEQEEADALVTLWLSGRPRPGQLDPPTPRCEPLARAATIAGFRQLITGLAEKQDLVLLVEDLHWLDHSSGEVISSILDSESPQPLLLLLSSRPAQGPAIEVPQHVLSPLDTSDALTLVRELCASHGVPIAVQREIVQHAGGLPLLLEQLTRALLDDPKQKTEGGPARWSAVPTSLRASIEGRLALTPGAQELLCAAAVCGGQLQTSLLSALLGRPAPAMNEQVGQALRSGLLRQGIDETELEFSHSLVREVIYGSIDRPRRTELHQRLTGILEERFAQRLSAHPELYVSHFEAAGNWRQAAQMRLAAGTLASQRGAHVEAKTHLTSALTHLGRAELSETETHRLELEIRDRLTLCLNATESWASAAVATNVARLRQLRPQGASTPKLRDLWSGFAVACLRFDDKGVAEALDQLDRSAETAAGAYIRHIAYANAHYARGHWRSASQHLDAAEILFADTSLHETLAACGEELLVEIPVYRACLYGYRGQREASLAQRQLAEHSQPNYPVAKTFGLVFSTGLGVALHDHLEPKSAVAQAQRADALLALADALENDLFRGVAEMARGRLMAAGNEVDDGLRRMARGFELYAASGAKLFLAQQALSVAEAHAEHDRWLGANQHIEIAWEECARHPLGAMYRAQVEALRARHHMRRGHLAQAQRCLAGAQRHVHRWARLDIQGCGPKFVADQIERTRRGLTHPAGSA